MADLIAVRVPTARGFLSAWDHVRGLGDAVLPIPATAPAAEVDRLLRALRPAAIVRPRPDGQVRVVRLPDPAPIADGTAAVVPTSGSTGEPKGVVLSEQALAASTAASVERLGCVPGDRWLLCLPLHHVAGLQVVLRSRHLGVEPLVHDGFDVAAVAAVAEAGTAAYVSLVPTQLHRLLDAGVDLSGLAGVLLGGAAPSAELLARADAGRVPVTVSYGMTETCGGCVHDGRPLDGVDVRVTADGSSTAAGGVGRIELSGPVLMDGYHRREDLTAAVLDRGWFRTSDVGRLGRDGRLEVVGRADDVLITGAENVVASEVARAVTSHPGVRDAVVVGRPDPEWGQRVVAVCELLDGRTLTLDELRDHLRGGLPAHALPRELVTVPRLPRDPMGKVRRAAVDELL